MPQDPPTAPVDRAQPATNSQFLKDQFLPGTWLQRRQFDLPDFSIVSGRYQRNQPVSGQWQAGDVHYFDMCLGRRPLESRGRFAQGVKDYRPMGEVLFVPAGQRYFGAGGCGEQRNLFLFLKVPEGDEDTMSLSHDLSARALDECLNLPSTKIKFILTQISQELYSPGFASEVMLEGLGTILLAETVRHFHQYDIPPPHKGGLSPRSMRLITERILSSNDLPSLSELASLCNLSRRHFMRAFRAEMGQTVGEFLQQKSMERARHLLVHTDTPVGLIATAVGFSSAAAFSTAFRRATAVSPREFRSSQRAQQVSFIDTPD